MNENANKNHDLNELYTILLKQQIPFVAYRLPKTSEILTLVQHRSFPKKLTSFDEIESKKGFIVSPFSEKNNHPKIFLEPDVVLSGQNVNDKILNELSENQNFINLNREKNNYKTTAKEYFISSVEKIISQIKSSVYQKVVLSKVKVEKTPENFRLDEFFLKLCEKYPSATVYLFQLPEAGIWAGATPETLLVMENHIATTMSLAGTQKAPNQPIEKYKWSDKELEEQKIVTDFIEKTLINTGIKNLTKSKTTNIQAANLIHLQTKFEFPVSEIKNKFGNLISALHPTPATGGLPKEKAVEFILHNEKHDRSYYSGFLGTFNINDKTNLFVNLRCVQFFEAEYVLYSGAGITSSSVAESEWEETENKMATMKNVIIS